MAARAASFIDLREGHSLARQCGICGTLLTPGNASREHVIPNALGGRRRVGGFLCRPCNSRTGVEWDAPLAAALQPFCILLGVRRHRGSVPSTRFNLAGYSPTDLRPKDSDSWSDVMGEENIVEVRMRPDGRVFPARFEFSDVTVGGTRRIRMRCRTSAELAQKTKDLREKYPQVDGDGSAIRVDDRSTYVPHFLGWDLALGGPAQGRAITKTALGLAVEAGVDPASCEKAQEYFKEDGRPCFSYFYDFDPIQNRPAGMPLHVVHIEGDPRGRSLTGYVELFGCIRYGVCLSTEYEGERLSRSHAINPMTGEAVDVTINLRCGPQQIRAMCDGAEFPSAECAAAIGRIMPTVSQAMEDRERERVLSESIRHAFEMLGVPDDGYIEPKQASRFAELVVENLRPYLLHRSQLGRVSHSSRGCRSK